MDGERWLILFLLVLFFGMMAQCYRDEGVEAMGRRNMCVKLSASMEEYEKCVAPPQKIKGDTDGSSSAD